VPWRSGGSVERSAGAALWAVALASRAAASLAPRLGAAASSRAGIVLAEMALFVGLEDVDPAALPALPGL